MVKEAEEDVRPYFHKFPSSPVEGRPVQVFEKTAAGVIINHLASMAQGRVFFTPIFMILNKRLSMA